MDTLEPACYRGSNLFLWLIFAIVSISCLYMAYSFIDVYLMPPSDGKVLGLVVFGFIFVVLFISLIFLFRAARKEKPALLLDDKGIRYQSFKSQIGDAYLAWEAMTDAKISRIGANRIRVIKINLSDEFADGIELPKSHRFMFGNSVLIYADFLVGKNTEMCARINEFICNNTGKQRHQRIP